MFEISTIKMKVSSTSKTGDMSDKLRSVLVADISNIFQLDGARFL
jgi:hypothetical protein